MLELKKGVDILTDVGGITDIASAKALLAEKLDAENQAKLAPITNEDALIKIAAAIAMCQPDSVFINTGSEADRAWIRALSLEKGEETPLAKDGHTIHFDLPTEQARLVAQTYYIVNESEKISALAQKMVRSEAHAYVAEHMVGIMKGATMIVGFYARGPVGAYASTPAIEMSSSTYVHHSADILYRNCYDRFDAEVERRGMFYTNVHCAGLNRLEDVPNARIFMDRSWQTTFSTYCTYAGNTLLLKKGNHRFSVDYATYFGSGKELSEHMFITGLNRPDGSITYFVGAAPSGCGKTTTAMVGTSFVGDDLAQIWIDDDGVCRAINPECGIFGIVNDVNREGDPWLMKALRDDDTEAIFSNVLVADGVPYWSGGSEPLPEKGVNFQGDWWQGKTDANGKEIPPSHKNARVTIDASAIANHNTAHNADPAGVPVKVVTYSGRDADTMPPVWVAKNNTHGVVIGASIVSKATATEIGATGVKRQPWANSSFIAGALADYLDAQFAFFNSDAYAEGARPIMAGLNFFLTHENRGGEGSGLLGEKRDVHVWLGWLAEYVDGNVGAIETPIGHMPKYDDLKALFARIDKDYSKELYDKQFALYVDNIVKRIDMQHDAYAKEDHLPPELFAVYAEQKAGLLALKAEHGAVVDIEKI
jgi:phosphoenolpyruvate carboxykinase (GTP)